MINPDQLHEAGLNETESRIYLYLLENGLTAPPQIAVGTNILRTNTYNALQKLELKGLVEQRSSGKRKAYLASNPTALVRLLEKRRERVEQLLPDLQALQTTQKNKPKVRFYDGLAEVKDIYWQATIAEEVFGIGSTKSLATLDPEFWSHFLRECKKHSVIFHDILTYESGSKESSEMREILGGLYDFALLDKSHGDQPTDILVFGDNIALITLEEPIFSTVLNSPLLAKTFRIVWSTMKKGL